MFPNTLARRTFRIVLATALVLVVLVGSAASVTPARAFNLILVDTADGGLNLSDGKCSLSEAIHNADNDLNPYADCTAGSGADTIVFDDALGTATITLTQPLTAIWSSPVAALTINGGGDITVNGAGSYRVFEVFTPATLQGLTVTGGHTPAFEGGGGVLVHSGTSLKIIDSTLSSNSAQNGGAVYNDGSTLSILDSSFLSNTSVSWGGAVEASGPSTEITNSTFHGNSGLFGGGVLINAGTNTITNSTFFGNNGGGAGTGGDLYVNGGTTNLYNSILADSILTGDCVQGGGAFVGANNLVQDLISSCGMTDGTGGNIVGHVPGLGVLTGSPQYFPLNAGSLAIDAGDNSRVPGGVTTDEAGNPRFADVPTVTDTGSGTPPIVDMGAVESQYSCPGGSQYYVDGSASGANDGSSWTDAFTHLQYALAAVVNCSGPNQVWVAQGLYTPGTNVTDSFTLPHGVSVYGGFAGTETTLEARDWTTNITVLSGDLQGNDITDGSGVVHDTADIYGNNSYHVVFIDATTGSIDPMVLDGFTITAGDGNGATDFTKGGGGLYCDGHGAGHECSPTLQNLTFSGNYATNGGGAIFNNGTSGGDSSPDLINVAFDDNRGGNGGAMLNYGFLGTSSPSLNGVTFDNNHANGVGGAIYNEAGGGEASPDLSGVEFVGNDSVADGGAIYTWGSGLVPPSLSDVTFSNNTAGGDGGGMFNHEVSPTLARVTFSDNGAHKGAAMFNDGNGGESSPKLSNVTFKSNHATQDGGAIYTRAVGGIGSPILKNVTFNGNTAGGLGGAMFNNDGGTGTVLPMLTNVILWGNTAVTDDPEISNSSGSELSSIDHSVVQDDCVSITPVSCGAGNLSTDPMLDALAANGGFTQTLALLAGSSAIDRGDDGICAAAPVGGIDQRGMPRPQGAHCDIGAYEKGLAAPEVIGLFPGDGSTSCRRPMLGAQVILTDLMRKGGSFDPTTVVLTLDGVDVTGLANNSQTETWPASEALVLYTPGADITPGFHQVIFKYPSATGTITALWGFTAAPIACPASTPHVPLGGPGPVGPLQIPTPISPGAGASNPDAVGVQP